MRKMVIEISGRKVGPGFPVFFIAEAGVNHNGSTTLAKELIEVARDAGADAVKFQSFKTENIITEKAPKSTYHEETTGSSETQSWFDLLKTQEMSAEMHRELIDYCKQQDILFMSTPYDAESLDLLIALDVPAIKIASTDTTNIPFLRKVAVKKVPTILSTAMCNMDEVAAAHRVFEEINHDQVAVLQCTGNYPAKLENTDLRVMETYRRKFSCPVGYSDHTMEDINPVAATALGANIYEKHFTLDRGLPGPDHRMSLEPAELADTIRKVRMTEKALGHDEKTVHDEEVENRTKLRKSLVTLAPVSAGDVFTAEMLAVKRPATGLKPALLDTIIGKKARADIPADTPLESNMIDD